MNKIIVTANAPNPIGPYSQAVKAGKFLFVSGQLAIDPKEGELVAADIKLQTRQVMENIKAILQAADYSLKDVLQSTVYLSSLDLFDEFNREYALYFDSDFSCTRYSWRGRTESWRTCRNFGCRLQRLTHPNNDKYKNPVDAK